MEDIDELGQYLDTKFHVFSQVITELVSHLTCRRTSLLLAPHYILYTIPSSSDVSLLKHRRNCLVITGPAVYNEIAKMSEKNPVASKNGSKGGLANRQIKEAGLASLPPKNPPDIASVREMSLQQVHLAELVYLIPLASAS